MPSSSQAVVTIIDDDREFLEMISQVVEEAGFAVKTYNYATFINLIEQDVPDVVLLDVWFDTFHSGLEIAKSMRMRQALQDVPLVLMSSDLDVVQYYQDVGADEYLAKPFTMDQLVATLRQVIN